MLLGLACAVGTSLCYGIGSVFQAVAAGDAPLSTRLDPLLLLRLMRAWRYVVGLSLDGIGFVLSLVALRTLPLYVVQSVVASFLAVTAVAGALMVETRLRRHEWAALVVVVLGLALVGLSAAPEPASVVAAQVQWLFVAVALVLVLASLAAGRLEGPRGGWALGGVAGVAFGVVAVAARALSSAGTRGSVLERLDELARAPASYALLVAAPLALIAYATALQRGGVVQATAPLVVGETVLPALVGLTLLGDHARAGWSVAAVAGFVLAVGAALPLSRFGEVTPPPALTESTRHPDQSGH